MLLESNEKSDNQSNAETPVKGKSSHEILEEYKSALQTLQEIYDGDSLSELATDVLSLVKEKLIQVNELESTVNTYKKLNDEQREKV